jgi:hypothetical protein
LRRDASRYCADAGQSHPAFSGVQTAKEGGMTTHHETGQDAASSEGTVTVTETGSGTYTQQITAGHHRLVADEPRRLATTPGQHPTIYYWPGT